MIPELGQFALCLALCLAIIQSFFPLVGAHTGNQSWMRLARPTAYACCFFIALAFLALVYAFVTQDFSVAYVARNSNSLLPMHYRVSAVWGAHEGSLLLWVLILCLWSIAVARFSRSIPQKYVSRVLAVMGIISVGFISFMLFTSNPFERHIPALPDGADLNPLLQDFGLIIHPPMLYFGYVGFSVAFAFAVAALLEGRLDSRWVRWTRPWTNIAWAFLTLGIALGSWWAYYELGWGGWWFWDPVENASFMPWLVGTALIHSQAMTEKRGSFKSWTILLAIAAFSLSLVGTFLVRSGVLTSVHAFASDPSRGMFILAFLAIVAGGALLLYMLRAPRVASGGWFQLASKEALMLVNNLVMVILAAIILLGTVYPLILEALNLGQISIGPPYFSIWFIWLMVPVVVLLPIGPFSQWSKDQPKRWINKFAVVAAAALLLSLLIWVMADAWSWRGFFGIAGGLWVAFATIQFAISRARKAKRRVAGIPVFSRGVWGMLIAHLGVGVFLIGVTFVEVTGVEKDLRMERGDRFEVAGYTFEFQGTAPAPGPNYRADRGTFAVFADDKQVANLYPEKRIYVNSDQMMTEAAIDPGLTRDLYVSLGEPLDANGVAWAVRVYVKPYVRWIWLGALLMMFGGALAASDRRYLLEARRNASADQPDTADADSPSLATAGARG